MKAVFCSLSLLLFFAGCKSDDNPVSPPNTEPGKITFGETVTVSSQSVDPSGGTIRIEKPGDKLNGMEIIIPANAFATTKNFKVSYAEIKSHELGQYFNPVSPAITIEYEGGYADVPIKVKIPVNPVSGDFVMGFFYNPKTGKLEGLPVESLDSNFITVSTRTFSTTTLSKSSGTGDLTSLMLIINAVSEAVLQSQGVIASGFNPGIDDWEFTNWGSYISAGGHCAGQAITSMWYYCEKRLKGDPPLYHRFDILNDRTNPGFLWQDNPLGYRFASVIQKDYDFANWVLRLKFEGFIPGLVFKAFAASILLTSEPQSVLIRNSSGKGGHAMIVYKVDYNAGKLYIADPNYPNNRASDGTQSIRTINYVNGKFETYETGLNAGGGSIPMDEIGYFGKTTYISWDKIRTRWAEVENKTIGNTAFPAYQLKVKNDNDKDLTDIYTTFNDTLRFYCKCPGVSGVNGTDMLWVQVFDENGNKISIQADEFSGIPAIPLNNGINKIGIYMCGYVQAEKSWSYIDFKWKTITKNLLKIYPDELNGFYNTEYTFTARTYGTAPLPYKMKWNFGDNTPEVTVENDSTVKHTFTAGGTYSVKVKLLDQGNVLIAEDSSKAIIAGGDMWISNITYSGYVGDTVLIRGFGFGDVKGTSYATFNPGKIASIISWSNTEIKTTVHDSAETGYVRVFVGNKSDSTNFIVKGNLYELIKSNSKVWFEFIASILFTDSSKAVRGINFSTIRDTVNPDITWSGHTFSYQRSTTEIIKKITGTLSPDGRIILYFKCEYFFSIPPPEPTAVPQLYMEERGFTVTNIPYKSVWPDLKRVTYEMNTSQGLENNSSNIYWNQYFISTDGYKSIEIDSIDWTYSNRVYITIGN